MGDNTAEDLALSGVFDVLERNRTTSAGVMRKRVYHLLGILGVDVPRMVTDAREVLKHELRLKQKRAVKRRQVLEERLDRADLTGEQREMARRALQSAPRTIAAHKIALQEIMNRPAVPPTAPTLERLRHAPEPVDTALVSAPGERWTLTKRFSWPVNAIADVLTAAEYEAAERYQWAFENRAGRAKGSNYGDAGAVGDPARKLGLTTNQEKAGREWDMWSRRVPAALRPVLDNFVLELKPRGADRPLSRAEWGKRYGKVQHDHQARGVSDGALKIACGVLAAIWAEYQDWLATQRSSIRAVAELPRVRALIDAGRLDEAARQIHAETVEREARRARGVPPVLIRKMLDGDYLGPSVSQVSIEVKR